MQHHGVACISRKQADFISVIIDKTDATATQTKYVQKCMCTKYTQYGYLMEFKEWNTVTFLKPFLLLKDLAKNETGDFGKL